MNFNQITMLSKMKNAMDTFRRNHPKFPLFLNAVSQDALVEGTIIEINVTTPEGDLLFLSGNAKVSYKAWR